MRIYICFVLFCFITIGTYSQIKDTITVTPKTLNTKMIKPGEHQYLVYFKDNKDGNRKNFEFWTRKIAINEKGDQKTIEIVQTWENNDTIFHKATSICDFKSFQPLFQQNWWKRNNQVYSNKFDFQKRLAIAQDRELKLDTTEKGGKILKAFEATNNTFFLNWHIDLEVFSTLPLKDKTAYKINFYNPGFPNEPQTVIYTVVGSGYLKDYNNQDVECWLLTHSGEGFNSLFYISKKTQEVLKLEQEYSGKYRYKIKLGFSS